jgi:hypothetical protein
MNVVLVFYGVAGLTLFVLFCYFFIKSVKKSFETARERYQEMLQYYREHPQPQEPYKSTWDEDSVEDSEGDGLMSEGDIMFPPELPEDDNDSED